MESKVCNKCKRNLSFDNFTKNKNRKYGIDSWCKGCMKEYRLENKDRISATIRKWEQDNAEHIKRKRKEYYINNKEKHNNDGKAWYKKNKESNLQYQKKWREENKEEIREKRKEYRLKNKDKIKERKREYYKKNREAIIKKQLERWHADNLYRIKHNLRVALNRAIKTKGYGQRLRAKKYNINYYEIIQHLGQCPGNREDYHIDHIFPLCAFNFNDEFEIWASFRPENHQWLRKEENLSKKDFYNIDDFNLYIERQREVYNFLNMENTNG